MTSYSHITIIGCGLIGGSLALALRRAGYGGRITAAGGTRGPQVALQRGMIDGIEESFARGERCEANLIYLAAPIGAIIDFLRTRGDLIAPGALVTDAGSTKAEICRIAKESLPAGVYFIGGHPMAGSESTGVEYARADLFDRATYALAAESTTDREKLALLEALVVDIGARPIMIDPVEHDAAVALISHLPQMLSSALATLLGPEFDGQVARRDLAQQLAASGWRDTTRLGASAWSVWRDIIMTNQPNISAALGQLVAELQALKESLDLRDFNRLRDLFTAANQSLEEQRARRYQSFEKL
jgi:prephenate dehydrogenase